MGFINWFAENKDGIVALSVLLAAFTSLGGVVWVANITTRAARNDQINRLREVWINELRNDISTLISILSDPKASDTSLFADRNLLIARIQMRLTSKSKTHIALSDAIVKFSNAVNPNDIHDSQIAIDAAHDLVWKAQDVLKEAWDQIAK